MTTPTDAQTPPVVEGEEAAWQRVPVEPTMEMDQAAVRAFQDPKNHHGDVLGEVYRAMLAAAPKSPGLPTEEEIAKAYRFGVHQSVCAGLSQFPTRDCTASELAGAAAVRSLIKNRTG